MKITFHPDGKLSGSTVELDLYRKHAEPRTPYWLSLEWLLATEIFYALVGRPTRLSLALPIPRKGNDEMPNFELANDWVLTIPIQTTDNAGTVEPMPAGDVFTAASSDPASLQAVIGTDAGGNPAVVVNALVRAASNVTVTVTDSAGLIAATQVFDIVADAADTNIVLNVAGATHTTQPVPAS